MSAFPAGCALPNQYGGLVQDAFLFLFSSFRDCLPPLQIRLEPVFQVLVLSGP